MSEIINQAFVKVIHLEHGGKGNGAGSGPANAAALATNANLWAIPAGAVIKKCYMIIDTPITGSTDIDVGDDDDADGFIDGSLSLTLGTAGMYGYDAKLAGAYLRKQTAGVTDPADIDVVENAKYYAAAGKEIKSVVTGASTAGKARIVIEGFLAGTNA